MKLELINNSTKFKLIVILMSLLVGSTLMGEPSYIPTPEATTIMQTKPTVAEPSTIAPMENVTVYLDGKQVTLTEPVVFDSSANRTFLPVRAIANLLGADVNWSPEHRVATVSDSKTLIELPVQKGFAAVTTNSVTQIKAIDTGNAKVSSMVINGRTYLPVRFVSEELNCKVNFFQNSGQPEIHLATGNNTVPTAPVNPNTPGNDPSEPNAEAMIALGDQYYDGDGVEQSYEEAMKWYQKAAELKHTTAMNIIGNMYYWGDGVPQDYKEAMKWYIKAVELNDGTAMNNIGNMYYWGEGVPQDYKEAMKWYQKAAELKHTTAMNNIGDMYYVGEGVSRNYKEAMKWYQKAAELKHTTAMNNIGDMYYMGEGVPKDYKEAMKWYQKAAELNNTTGMNYIGKMYYMGKGVPQDYKEAMKWYLKAAELGSTEAMEEIGHMYANGLGVTKDDEEAIRWYLKAAELGYE